MLFVIIVIACVVVRGMGWWWAALAPQPVARLPLDVGRMQNETSTPDDALLYF